MGFWDFLKALFGTGGPRLRKLNLVPPPEGRGLDQLAERLGLSVDHLKAVPLDYRQFEIPKRSVGKRTITSPNQQLKEVQRRILDRLLSRLATHPAATGFVRNASIVTNASCHVGSDVILRMDIKDFFHSTSADRVRAYLYAIGWGQEATDLLINLCTYQDCLPQGAPTSPKLSNLVNYELDARLDGYARKLNARYTRYADDLTFSFAMYDANPVIVYGWNPKTLRGVTYGAKGPQYSRLVIRMTKKVLAEYGYALHMKRKLNIRLQHQCQKVTGLVVNEKVALPRKTRRWLRAVEHHIIAGRGATLTAEQLAGWKALQHMIDTQSQPDAWSS